MKSHIETLLELDPYSLSQKEKNENFASAISSSNTFSLPSS